MLDRVCGRTRCVALCALWLAAVALVLTGTPTRAMAQAVSIEDVIGSLVRLKTIINPDGRTTETLGREREGSGVVIDTSGLVLTIGYLMVEAHAAEITTSDGRTHAAEVVGYDHDTGFGLLRASSPLNVKPMALGTSSSLSVGQRVIAAAAGGPDFLGAVQVASKREFAGYWEYLLDEAIFTEPPVPWWSGAALVNSEGRLVGIGSLVVGDASKSGEPTPGNMFVPVDLLGPILGELIGSGKVSGPQRPWLGITTHEISGHLLVARVVHGGPAEKAGLQAGDIITAVHGKRTASLPALYREIWSQGSAGVTVPLDIVRAGEKQRLEVKSAGRRDFLRLRSTF